MAQEAWLVMLAMQNLCNWHPAQCFTLANSRLAENRSPRDNYRRAMRERCTSIIDFNTDKLVFTYQATSDQVIIKSHMLLSPAKWN